MKKKYKVTFILEDEEEPLLNKAQVIEVIQKIIVGEVTGYDFDISELKVEPV